ncbi:MAG: ABC transporter ATP-binding protein, partial [Candidatus Moranbacteria bacterium]|nr:ABC transporter ATP-binding protein [Candidatus Moranbacteria bacterium]
MIHLDNVSKYYLVREKKRFVFQNVSLSIPDRTNVGIIGRNGAGKSTLLRILGGIDHPSSGRIVSNIKFSWPMGLAGGFQGSLTGRENARFVCRIYSKTSSEEHQAIEYIHNFSELGEYFDLPIKTYSSGMRARLNFGLSLAFDFDYYLIDETLSVGDPIFRAKAEQALKDLTSKRNFLLVSHSLPILKKMCDSAILLHNGSLTYYPNI